MIYFMDSYNYVFIFYCIFRKIIVFFWKIFFIVIRNGIFICFKYCFMFFSLFLDRVIFNKVVKLVIILIIVSCICLNVFVFVREYYF